METRKSINQELLHILTTNKLPENTSTIDFCRMVTKFLAQDQQEQDKFFDQLKVSSIPHEHSISNITNVLNTPTAMEFHGVTTFRDKVISTIQNKSKAEDLANQFIDNLLRLQQEYKTQNEISLLATISQFLSLNNKTNNQYATIFYNKISPFMQDDKILALVKKTLQSEDVAMNREHKLQFIKEVDSLALSKPSRITSSESIFRRRPSKSTDEKSPSIDSPNSPRKSGK